MESEANLRQDLADAERASAAVYVDYPAMPAWYAPATGAWSAALTATLVLLHDRPLLDIVAIVVLVAIDLAFIAWYRGKRGTMPSMRNAPPEIRHEMRLFLLAAALVVAVVAVAALLAPPVVPIALALVLVTAGVEVYERRYARASDAVRARLA